MIKCLKIVILLSLVSLSLANEGSGKMETVTPQTVKILLIMDHNYGANYHFILEIFEEYGWNITVTGLFDPLTPCRYQDQSNILGIDILIDDVALTQGYHCISIMPGQTHTNLLGSNVVLDLIRSAVSSNIIVSAWCNAVRILAKADVINGINITGAESYQSEYEAAGATFFEYVPPIRDGNIITSVRSRFYRNETCELIKKACDELLAAGGTITVNKTSFPFTILTIISFLLYVIKRNKNNRIK